MASTYDSFSTNFINPVITPIASQNEEPNYASIRVARTQLHDNAAAIFSPAGGGCHGHLALTMTDAEYFAITNVAFTVPTNPTGDPVMVRNSRLESAENLRKHEEAKKAFKLYHDVDKALRKQLIAPTPEVYLQDLRDPILGYANITCLAIIGGSPPHPGSPRAPQVLNPEYGRPSTGAIFITWWGCRSIYMPDPTTNQIDQCGTGICIVCCLDNNLWRAPPTQAGDNHGADFTVMIVASGPVREGGLVHAIAVTQPVQSWTVIRDQDDFRAVSDALSQVLKEGGGGSLLSREVTFTS
eukprot:scaffold23069_cov79-Attheya_sp.AAC.3